MDNKHGGGLHMLTFTLVIIGGLNWLLYAIFSWEVGMIFGEPNNLIARIIYILVGLSAVYEIFCHKNICKHCESMSKSSSTPGQSMTPQG